MTPLFGGNKGSNEEQRARSAAEREAARIERERRRAERAGRALPSEPGGPSSKPSVAPEPQGGHRPPSYDDKGLPPYEAPAEIPAPEVGGLSRHDEPFFEPDPEPVSVPPAAEEEPAGVRRVPAPTVGDLPQVAGERPPVPAARLPRQGRSSRPPKTRGVPRRRHGGRLVALLLLVLIVAVGYFAFRVAQPFADDGDASHPVAITIPPGATASQIGDQLAQAGVIDSSFFFGIRSRLSGQRGDLKAGRFTLKRDMSYAAALDALTQNPAAAPTVKVAMPEGRSISEAAPTVRAAVSGSYVKAATRNPREVTGLKAYGVPKGTRTLEGFLFPATYELKRGRTTATASKLVAQQLATFRQTFNALDRRAAHRRHLTDYDVLIIASMIEREAEVAKDRPLISAVIYNRLAQHIPLGIDATLRYGLNNWTRPLKQSELQNGSVFNTRTHQDLPPTPIGSPGLASIKAALKPAKVSYLYYVVKPCGNGAHAFSSTDAQFQRDVNAYNKKRDQRGGKDPSHC